MEPAYLRDSSPPSLSIPADLESLSEDKISEIFERLSPDLLLEYEKSANKKIQNSASKILTKNLKTNLGLSTIDERVKAAMLSRFYTSAQYDFRMDRYKGLMLLMKYNHTDVLDKLLAGDDSFADDFFVIASKEGNIEVLKKLLTDPRVDTRTLFGEALNEAVANCQNEVVKLLLSEKEINLSEISLLSGISRSLSKNPSETLKILLSDKRIDFSKYEMLFVYARARNCLDTLKILLDDDDFLDKLPFKELLASDAVTIYKGNEKDLIRIAKAFAKKNDISPIINQFGISDQAALIEIAKIATRRPFSSVSEYIKNYGIKDEAALQEIAKLDAAKSVNINQFIKNYGIKDQAALVEIAKIAITRSASSVCEYIKNYGISDEATLLEIAKLAAKFCPLGKFFNNFGIQNQRAIVDIVKTNVREIGPEILQDIERFGIVNISDIFEIIQTAQSKNPEKMMGSFKLMSADLRALCAYGLTDLNLNKFVDEIPLYHPTEKETRWLQESELLNVIWNFKNQPIRQKLIVSLKEVLQTREFYTGLFKSESSQKKIPKYPYLKLPAVFLCALKSQGLSEECLTMVGRSIAGNREFKNSKHEKTLLNVLIKLLEDKKLSSQDKQNILHIVFGDKAKTLQSLSNVQAILEMDSEQLKISTLKEVNQDLGVLTLRIFQKHTPIGLIDDFGKKYDNFLNTFRKPEAILTYAASLNQLHSPEKEICLDVFKGYLQSLFNQSFKKERYRSDISSHLETVLKNRDLEKEWIKGHQWKIGEFYPASPPSRYKNWTVVDTDNPCDLLMSGTETAGSCQRIDNNPEVSKCLLANLMDGKNRLLATKNEEGVITSRCFLRLLWDKEAEKPVLFLDAIYPPVVSEEISNILLSAAVERATALNIPLVSKANLTGKTSVAYPNPIHSLETKAAPYEFVDAHFTNPNNALNALHKNGIYRIVDSHVLFMPTAARG